MIKATKDKICQVCSHSVTCGFISRDLQDDCPTIQQCDDGYDLAINDVSEWLKTNYEDIGIRYMRGYSANDLIEQIKQEFEV